jgi:hypothetical protein
MTAKDEQRQQPLQQQIPYGNDRKKGKSEGHCLGYGQGSI